MPAEANSARAAYEAALPPLEKYAALLSEAQHLRGVSLAREAWRRLRRNRAAIVSLVFLVLLGLVSLLTPVFPLQSPIRQDLEHRQFEPPGWGTVPLELADKSGDAFTTGMNDLWHQPGFFDRALIRVRVALFGDWCIPSLCGTDNLGRDLLARLIWGSRVSLTVGLVATLVSLVIGVSYGAIAGYFGGWVDMVMMRLVDVLYSIPFIFIVIYVITFLREEKIQKALARVHIDQTVAFYLLIGAVFWLTMARVVRGQVLSLKHEQFVEGARAAGASRWRIIFLHLVPNCLGIVIVYLTLTIPSVMLFESFLSFLGLGVSPPDVSWGLLANDILQAITPVKTYWWLVVFPASTLALTLFALNFLGDGLRDALDPRLKNR